MKIPGLKKVKLYSVLTGRGVEMEYGDFRYLGIWSAKNDAPFVALEPWTGCGTAVDEDDCFEKKRGMKLLLIRNHRRWHGK